MDRRSFLQNLAAVSALDGVPAAAPDNGTPICQFSFEGDEWKVYEDLRELRGAITFLSSRGVRRVFAKSAEASFAEAEPPHLGLSLRDIGLSGADLLADRLLAGGDDPDPERVKSAAPPQGSTAPAKPSHAPPFPSWDALVGTRECYDTQPVFPRGSTRTYHPEQMVPALRGPVVRKRYDGLLGGWMPAVRKVFPLDAESHCEVIVFGDVEARDRFIVQTWHRTAIVRNGRFAEVHYGHTYPPFPPARTAPPAEAFYRALLVFAAYWERLLQDTAPASLPDGSWADMSRHAFAKELMVRPGGVYPKYGAVDRDYYGSEYDGFQDIFTSALYTNLEWGRFEMARLILDNYLSEYTDSSGMINMRGPETAQFGLTLSLVARYLNYTGDTATVRKHRAKIAATAKLLLDLHDASLRLPEDRPGYGLIHGWSESDACLAPTPDVWWQPYFANTAFAVRGLRDIARVWREFSPEESERWLRRSEVLNKALLAAIEKNVWRDRTPPYLGPLPGTKLTFREALGKEWPSPQQWPHRPYAELLQADVLPPETAHLVVDCMRAYGATTLGVVANVSVSRPDGREILGFISYGYAQALLRLDRIEEYLLFLYSHRYHAHTRGGWVAGEVSDITGGTALFCIPAQQTIPLLVRWMLVLEDSDEDRLYLAKGVPRAWVASGKEIGIAQAPTRWGRIDFRMAAKPAAKQISATVDLARAGAPKEVHLKLRLPRGSTLGSVRVNGRPATIGGIHNDTVIFQTANAKRFEVIADYA